MPCRDGGPSPWEENANRIKFLESALCASLRSLELAHPGCDFYDTLDYAEAGITKHELTSWHFTHMEQDRLRREREAELKRQADLKALAMSKLTAEECKALGIRI